MVDPAEACRGLRDALARHGFTHVYQTDMGGGSDMGVGPKDMGGGSNNDDMAVLSVWYNLTVWCTGGVFLWRSGYAFEDFDTHPASDPAGAARRIVERYDELRTRRDLYGG